MTQGRIPQNKVLKSSQERRFLILWYWRLNYSKIKALAQRDELVEGGWWVAPPSSKLKRRQRRKGQCTRKCRQVTVQRKSALTIQTATSPSENTRHVGFSVCRTQFHLH
jgi:hypothetical protein